jgi:N-acetylmuramoyl-L-alanine amidase
MIFSKHKNNSFFYTTVFLFSIVCLFFSAGASFSNNCDEIKVLALNIYHEARGEGPDGMQMVGEVTLNRVEHSRYPDTVCDVVYQRRQFSWTHTRKDHTPHETEVWEEALEIAEGLLSDEIEKFNNGATHFLNPKRVNRVPSWVNKFEYVGRIGNHDFYTKGL